MSWNDTTYSEIVEKHAVLDGKPESVALAVWALSENKDMTPQDWRDLSKKTGVEVRGRAVGSAREILGLRQPKPAPKKSGAKRGRGRPKGSKNKKGTAASSPAIAVDSLVSTIKELQRERDAAVKTLDKMRSLLDSVA